MRCLDRIETGSRPKARWPLAPWRTPPALSPLLAPQVFRPLQGQEVGHDGSRAFESVRIVYICAGKGKAGSRKMQ